MHGLKDLSRKGYESKIGSIAKNLLKCWVQAVLVSELSRFVECAQIMILYKKYDNI